MKKHEALAEIDNIFYDLSTTGKTKKSLSEALFMADMRVENLTKEEIILLYRNTDLLSPLWNTVSAIISGQIRLDTHQTRNNGWMK